MRLIDADRLKEALHEDCMTAMGTIDESTLDLLMIEIDEIPTAYDVDKVIEKLEEEKTEINSMFPDDRALQRHWNNAIDVCAAIVKGGGQGE